MTLWVIEAGSPPMQLARRRSGDFSRSCRMNKCLEPCRGRGDCSVRLRHGLAGAEVPVIDAPGRMVLDQVASGGQTPGESFSLTAQHVELGGGDKGGGQANILADVQRGTAPIPVARRLGRIVPRGPVHVVERETSEPSPNLR